MESVQDLPITRVCIISDPNRCPPNYILIDKTYDRLGDADLGESVFLRGKWMRYLCVERQIPLQNQDVLIDVTLINERDPVPAGFTVIDVTHDTREKATKKKCICVRWMVPSMTADAITELIFLSRGQKRAPKGYTLVGELNNMFLCYKMGNVPRCASGDQAATPLHSMAPLTSSLPYAMNPPPVPPRLSIPSGQATLTRTGPPEQSASSLATGHVNPISGIEWKMNPKFRVLIELQNLTVPEVRGKTLSEIDQQYQYDFNVERSVSKSSGLS